MKNICNACKLQPNALDINVGDQIEQLDQIINETDGHTYFTKTFIPCSGNMISQKLHLYMPVSEKWVVPWRGV